MTEASYMTFLDIVYEQVPPMGRWENSMSDMWSFENNARYLLASI